MSKRNERMAATRSVEDTPIWMLKGFSVPLTPQGKSALATLPAWHYSSDCIAIEYWTDPQAIAVLLPPGLSLDEKSEGRAFFWFLGWQFTGSNDELTAPARYQYREAFALVEAVFEDTSVNYCPFIFVDNDAAIARGWAQGFPKKLGSVYQNAIVFGSQRGSGTSHEGKSLRRERLGARRTTGDRSYPAGGEGQRPLVGVQPYNGDAPILSPTGGQSWGQAAG
jgi:hypothetical protein